MVDCFFQFKDAKDRECAWNNDKQEFGRYEVHPVEPLEGMPPIEAMNYAYNNANVYWTKAEYPVKMVHKCIVRTHHLDSSKIEETTII